MEEDVSLFNIESDEEDSTIEDENLNETIKETEDNVEPHDKCEIMLSYILHLDNGIETLDEEFADFKEKTEADAIAANEKLKNLNIETKFTKWTLIAFMAVNVTVTCMALVRHDERSHGIQAESSWQIWMDEHYDDARMAKIYPDAQQAN